MAGKGTPNAPMSVQVRTSPPIKPPDGSKMARPRPLRGVCGAGGGRGPPEIGVARIASKRKAGVGITVPHPAGRSHGTR